MTVHAGKYLLLAGCNYIQTTELNIAEEGLTLIGEIPSVEKRPATVMPRALEEDGSSGFTSWPNGNFQIFGEESQLKVKNIIFYGMTE